MKRIPLTILLVLCSVPASRAAAPPDLKNQAAWTEKEKQEFLGFLRSNQQLPVTGQVKYVPPQKGGRSGFGKARYASLALQTDTMIIETGGGRTKTETATIGPKLLVGGHMFSWVRYYAGLQYNRIGQDKRDGTRAQLSHLQVPLGVELALIPLGTPQTRYVLLRGGVSEHYFAGNAKKADFRAPLLGWRPAWNLGLGYEWQFAGSGWRFHSLAEGYRSFSSGGTRFSGLGVTAGFVYTF